MIKERSRILRIQDNVIVTNFKCMFSSINNLQICELNPNVKENHKKIMLWRNPIDRTISCFLHWFILFPKKRKIFTELKHLIVLKKQEKKYIKELEWLMNILVNRDDFDLKEYEILLNNNNIIKLFKLYLTILPKIKHKNEHLQSQINIIEKKNMTINNFINIDIPEEIQEFENMINQKIPLYNTSSVKDKTIIKKFLENNPKYIQIIYKIYIDDFIFFYFKKKSDIKQKY